MIITYCQYLQMTAFGLQLNGPIRLFHFILILFDYTLQYYNFIVVCTDLPLRCLLAYCIRLRWPDIEIVYNMTIFYRIFFILYNTVCEYHFLILSSNLQTTALYNNITYLYMLNRSRFS